MTLFPPKRDVYTFLTLFTSNKRMFIVLLFTHSSLERKESVFYRFFLQILYYFLQFCKNSIFTHVP